jgi:hypothetical protein
MTNKMTKEKYCDLHTHSFYSDGISSPAEIVATAKLKGLDVIALTDHDTLAGYDEAKVEAEKWDILLVPGCEFSTRDYHILGLGFDVKNKAMLDLIEHSKNLQFEIARKRIDVLMDSGLPITFEKVEKYAKSSIGKYNIFIAMLLDRECNKYLKEKYPGADPEKLMELYLRKNGIASKVRNKPNLSVSEVSDVVRQAGGIVSIAHAVKDMDNLDKIIPLLDSLDAIEIQPNLSLTKYAEQQNKLESYAKQYGKSLTYGSDYHGPNFSRHILARKTNILSKELEGRLEIK